MALLFDDDRFVVFRLKSRFVRSVHDPVGRAIVRAGALQLSNEAYNNAGWSALDMARLATPPLDARATREASDPSQAAARTHRQRADDASASLPAYEPSQRHFSFAKRAMAHGPLAVDEYPEDGTDEEDAKDEPDLGLDDETDEEAEQMTDSTGHPSSSMEPKKPERRRQHSDDEDDASSGVEWPMAGSASTSNSSQLPGQEVQSSAAHLQESSATDPLSSSLLSNTLARDALVSSTDELEDFEDDSLTPVARSVVATQSLPQLAEIPAIDISEITSVGKRARGNGARARRSSSFMMRPIYHPPNVSALTTLLREDSVKSHNPLYEQSARFDGTGDPAALRLQIYRPSGPKGQQDPWTITIKPTITVADTIAFALYRYVEEKREPPLEPPLLLPANWTLRIVEDDGEVDDDFPALERSREICKFSFDKFALVEAKNIVAREPAPAETHAVENGPPLRPNEIINIRLYYQTHVNASAVHRKYTHVQAELRTYLADVLDAFCKPRNLDSNAYALRVTGTQIIAPLDRVVQSLQGNYELDVIQRRLLSTIPLLHSASAMSPSAPIVGPNRQTQMFTPALVHSELLVNNTYEKFNIWRRYPMSLMGKHERVLAIDGEYVQILPSESKIIVDVPKTSSIHASRILVCKQSRKVPVNFKLVVTKAKETKRYDFEAHSSQEAALIVSRIRRLMKSLQH